jgi:DNA-binding CsgD family transcriptional regulator
MTGYSFSPVELSRKERVGVSLFSVGLAIFLTVDVIGDWSNGASLAHIIGEGLLSIVACLAAVWVNRKLFRMRAQLNSAEIELMKSSGLADSFQADAMKWKAESLKFSSGLSQAIDAQMERWNLSSAEKQVALLLLKGLSLKEIADLRSVSEGTIRQQTVAVYEKSKTGGRAELSAFFLEDLLLAPTPLGREPRMDS